MAASKEPIPVVVTGAAGQIAYSLLYMLARGDVFGEDQPIALHLLDIPPMMGVLEGVVMELRDCAFRTLARIVATADPTEAFRGVRAAFLVGSMPRKQGMERKDLLGANVEIFEVQGRALDAVADKRCRVLVVGNPANTNAFICARYAPSIPARNFSAMTRLDQNRAQAEVASQLGVAVSRVSDVFIWGNHSSTQVPDATSLGRVAADAGDSVAGSVADAFAARAVALDAFTDFVQKRGAAVIAARKMSSAMSAAKAAADHMRDWFAGTGDRVVSMAVLSAGEYGAPKDVMFSFPVRVDAAGEWAIVEGVAVDERTRGLLEATGRELVEEREIALEVVEGKKNKL